ncbi:hypothetical protein NH340_JMT00920 [Sarcoptes scabiei]|nr:hypothetical protein NH340_JMT00920 [Sarcoptes scabiei]
MVHQNVVNQTDQVSAFEMNQIDWFELKSQCLIDNNISVFENSIRKFLKSSFQKKRKRIVIDNDPDGDTIEEFTFDEKIYVELQKFLLFIQSVLNDERFTSILNLTLDLIIGHSIIRSVFLHPQHFDSELRLKLIELFETIASNQIEHCKTHTNLIDFILSLYHATLSREDQILLRLLSRFEKSNFGWFYNQPLIWGENGISFYAAKHSKKLPFLERPRIDQIFQGFESSKAFRMSLSCFPINISLEKPFEVIEDIDLPNRLDPRFMVPMLFHFVSVPSMPKYHKFINHGCLSYVIAALSSECILTRKLAYGILARFYSLLENSAYPQDRQLWIDLIDFIRSGLFEANQRIDCCHTVLFVRIIEILLNPTSLLFPTIRNYLIHNQSKPYSYQHIPSIYQTCWREIPGSNRIAVLKHQKFIINWITDSLRMKTDVKIWNRRFVFSEMMIFHSSPICSNEIRLLILRMLQILAAKPEGAKILCTQLSIFAWINHQLCIQPHYGFEENTIPKDSLYRLVMTLWRTVYNQRKEIERDPKQQSEKSSLFDFYSRFSFESIQILSKIIFKVSDPQRINEFVRVCRKTLKRITDEHQIKLIKALILLNLPKNLQTLIID